MAFIAERRSNKKNLSSSSVFELVCSESVRHSIPPFSPSCKYVNYRLIIDPWKKKERRGKRREKRRRGRRGREKEEREREKEEVFCAKKEWVMGARALKNRYRLPDFVSLNRRRVQTVLDLCCVFRTLLLSGAESHISLFPQFLFPPVRKTSSSVSFSVIAGVEEGGEGEGKKRKAELESLAE